MGRSHKDRDAPPIKNTTLRPLVSHDADDNEAGMHPIVGHGDPLSNDEATEQTGGGVLIGNEAPGPRKIGDGPGEDEGGNVAGGEPNAKP